MRLFSALAHRSFALLFTARAVSALGDGIYLVALAWYVIQTTGSAAANGFILICATVPLLLFSLVGGVAVDRLPRRGLLFATDISRGIIVGIVAFLAWQHLLAFWHLAVLSALFGTAEAFSFPANRGIVPLILPPEALASANSLISLSSQGASILGPAIGGLLLAIHGTPLAFALDALSFFLSAGCILAMRVVATPAVADGLDGEDGAGEQASALGDLREGLATVLRSPWLWITIVIAGVSNLTLSGPLQVALPLLVKQHLHSGASVYALLNAAIAAGSVVAAVSLGQVTKLRHRGLLLYGMWLVAALAMLVTGLPVGVLGAGLAMLVWGAGVEGLGLVWAHTLQELVPLEKLGRVSSIDALGSFALTPIGFGLAGIAADALGAAPIFVLGGALSAGIIALGLLHPQVRELD